MKTKILISAILFSITFLTAQNQNAKWYFGNHAALDFMTSPPTILNNSASNSGFGCSTISDGSGNLLFYTDGMTVYDQTHSIMANGTGLGTTTNSIDYQYSMIVKQPGNTNIYFVFSNCYSGSLTGLYYSIVDMNLAAGMGSVTVKNSMAANYQPAGLMTAVQHCNGTDVWVLTHEFGNSNFRAFLVSSSGVSTSPVISSVGLNGAVSSYLKVSGNGKKAATVYNSSFLSIYDFDNSTGIFTSTFTLSAQSDGAYYQGMEFSPDGTKLYCVMNQYLNHRIAQWNLCAGSNTAIIASQYTVAATNMVNGIQLAPDGKIYVARLNQTSLGVINNPNAAGAACNYVNAGQSIAPGICSSGLPGFASKPRVSPPFTYSINCQKVNYTNVAATSTAINNCALANYSVVSSFWNFGDPASTTNNTSTAQSPSHHYSSVGTFTTQLILNYPCRSDTLTQVITISIPSPTFSITGPSTICVGNQAVFTATSTSASTYTWSNGANTNSIAVTPTVNTSYTVNGTSSPSSCSWYNVVSVVVNKCTSLENLNTVFEHVAIYPNPASSHLTIETDNVNERQTKLVIVNSLGQIVFSKTLVSGKEEIDLSTWKKGMYLMQIKCGEMTRTKKLVVN